jgi:AraC-like DNA-binding protein
VTAVKCDGLHPGWSREEALTDHALVLVRSGIFRRRVDGNERLTDRSSGYLERPGMVQQVAHPCGGDSCTVIGLSQDVIRTFVDPPNETVYSLPITPVLDLEHRTLLQRIHEGTDLHELGELIDLLVGHVLETARESRDGRGWRATKSTHRLADAAREVLWRQPELGLDDLASLLGVSPYRLSRAFKTATGITVSEHRLRVRSHMAIERIAGGDRSLARVAVDSGFADQAHMTRTLRRQIHLTPRALRELLRDA